jgi:hypothetical protein
MLMTESPRITSGFAPIWVMQRRNVITAINLNADNSTQIDKFHPVLTRL